MDTPPCKWQVLGWCFLGEWSSRIWQPIYLLQDAHASKVCGIYTLYTIMHMHMYTIDISLYFFFRVTTRATVECTRVSIHLYSADFAKNRCCNVIFCFSWCWCSSHINKKTAQNMAQYPQRKIIGTHLHMEVSWNGGTGTPKSSILTYFNRMFHYKPTILGIPHL